MSVQNVDPQWDPYPYDDTLPDLSDLKFDPKDRKGNLVKFLWGVATSSYQVEGNITTNDWDVFTHIEDINERLNVLLVKWVGHVNLKIESPEGAVGHWNLDVFAQDLALAKSLGMNVYRLSLEWSRIQPINQNDFDFDAIGHYRKMLNLIIENGMLPVLTLNHITLPKWILTPPQTLGAAIEDDGFKKSFQGWETQATVNAFVNFVSVVVSKFKDLVKYWITFNEPVASVMGAGYLAGIWSPGFVYIGDLPGIGDRAKKVLFNLIEAHVLAYDAIKNLAGPDAQVGIAHAMVFPRVSQEQSVGNNEEAAAQWDYCFNRFFLEAVIDGKENKDVVLNNTNTTVRDDWKSKLDFIGINYYRSVYIKAVSPLVPWFGGIFDEDLNTSAYEDHHCLNDLGWEIYPGGLYRFLKYLDENFHLPILITENGVAEESDGLPVSGVPTGKRAPYIVAHLEQVLHAIKDGVNVLGYIHWSIVDNWEWAYDYLPKARFGLYTVNGDDGSRTKTQGAVALEYIISERKIGDAKAKFGAYTPSGDN